ncbi:MAG TPA: hypothetical protein VKG20_20600 [Methylomirabilota bacterium]|nr:hypothetical protein [Methylomirabilota bacterium]
MPSDEDDRGAWFRWQYFHPSEAEDPATAFAAGRRFGRREMLAASVRFSGLMESMDRLADMLDELRVEREVEASDRRHQFTGGDFVT